ncbi:hypothetical protein AXA65_15600 [Chryseobacterium sp. FP211-J200]|nr:hypothetical protein AXA65_15600 [Chryseobacterium sp. FP211-J200]
MSNVFRKSKKVNRIVILFLIKKGTLNPKVILFHFYLIISNTAFSINNKAIQPIHFRKPND